MCAVNGMLARRALHALRILMSSGAPELRSRYQSSKLPWLYEDRSMQVKLPGVFNLCKVPSALAVSERPWQIHCSAVAVSHHGRDTPWCTTYGNDTVAAFFVRTATNVHPNPILFTRWLHTAWLCMADRPSSQRHSHNTHFLENLELCREYVPHM